jgi:hypothetical protein
MNSGNGNVTMMSGNQLLLQRANPSLTNNNPVISTANGQSYLQVPMSSNFYSSSLTLWQNGLECFVRQVQYLQVKVEFN